MKLPMPSVNFGNILKQQMVKDDRASQIFSYNKVGNITANISEAPVGAVLEDGVITDFLVALGNRGRDDAETLSIAAVLKKNGTSVLSGEVTLSDSASGEAGTLSFASVPTFETTAVIRGDLLSLDLTVTRTASPTTEMQNLYTTVKIVPKT